ncbi:uncharacterized protein MYCGRDRAFT_91033 [Zymoseptoria tritici IPO323]|uniref:Uncharacterized protein n=1 Tax=Zymoseptoria tritici (strain CBS 115943 / IPO323) TaxID=336722 RepID=F9X4N9_ZYMTI|nr:uncharacterized protein MYCGRDRAFT_91033 [Zymoseptoria tritici IPO323]EGP90079.1 hypothetical protein MYCGRDRAFT_91033 [Zymoseptoria tritici IPO323]
MSSNFTPQKACSDRPNSSTTSSMTADTRRDAYFANLYVLPSSDGTSYANAIATSSTTSSTSQESLMVRLASPALLNHQVRLCDLGCKFCAEDEKERRKARGVRGTLRRWWGGWKGEKPAYCGKEIWERHTKEQCRVYCRVEE